MGGASCHVGELTRGTVVLGVAGLTSESFKLRGEYSLEGDLSVGRIV